MWHRCGVLDATEEQQMEWMRDTINYLAERYPDLSREELGELNTMGMRFCAPVIPHGKENTALSPEEGNTEASPTSEVAAA